MTTTTAVDRDAATQVLGEVLRRFILDPERKDTFVMVDGCRRDRCSLVLDGRINITRQEAELLSALLAGE